MTRASSGLRCVALGAVLIASAVPAFSVSAGSQVVAAAPARAAPALTFHCTLTATASQSMIRVVYRLRSDGPRQRWRLQMWDGDVRFYAKVVFANAKGRFKIAAETTNRPGKDRLIARARHRATGAVCEVRLTA